MCRVFDGFPGKRAVKGWPDDVASTNVGRAKVARGRERKG